MKNISIFQLVFLFCFGLFLAAGIIVVAVYSNQANRGQTQKPTVTIWGTLDAGLVNEVVGDTNGNNQNLDIVYRQKSALTFDSDLAEAIAVGKGPDAILLRQDSLVPNLAKIETITYDKYPARNFRDSFLEEGELFLSSTGVVAVPFMIDPMVMYWNRDLFSQAGLVNPPRFWDELFSLAGQLTKKDASGVITQGGVALGAYENINNAKEIISGLFIQSGNSIATWNAERSGIEVTLSQAPTSPANVLSFYTQFSDSRKSVFTWARSLPDSESMFLSNRLGIYFGFSSEARTLKAKSPNLNFDVALVPQTRNSQAQEVFGRLYGFAILRSSKNNIPTLQAIQSLTSPDVIKKLSGLSGLPPVRRDVVVTDVKDPFRSVFTQSSLISRGWLDPKPAESDSIFKNMIEQVLSGFLDAGGAVGEAEQRLRYITPQR